MPLDGPTNSAPDLTSYSLEGLAWILRNGNDGHEWHYADRCRCAIRTAKSRWGHDLSDADLALGDTYAAAAIFLTGAEGSVITPAIVADRIDDHLAGRRIRHLVAGDMNDVLVDA